jgi:hypothetical protein
MKMKLICIAFAVITAGCGGGGSSSPSSVTTAVTSPVASPLTSPVSSPVTLIGTLTLEGTAATGAPLAGAAISATCASGSGSSVSAANGTYNISISKGLLPCVVRATSADTKTVLHSVIEGSGDGKVTANITTFSELIVAQVHGSSATDFFDQFASTKSKLTVASVNDAKTKVNQALSSIVDLTGIDPIKDTLIAATNGSAGNGLDKKLDALRDKLALAELTTNDLFKLFSANAGGSVGEVIKVTLQPQSSICPGFRSGDYLYIDSNATVPVQTQVFNAKTLKLGPEQYSGPNCYLATANGPKAAFGSQGIGIGISSQSNLAVLLPKQNLVLNDLTGTWNYVERAKITGTNNFKVSWGEITVASDGKAIATKSCDANGCTIISSANLTSFSATTDGAFVAKDGMRAFSYRAATGVMSMIGIDKANGDTGRLFIARKGTVAVTPLVTDSRDNFDIKLTATSQIDTIINLKAYAITPGLNNTFVRTSLADCQVETLSIGQPFMQMFERAAGMSPDCVNPNAINLVDLKILPPAGLGFSATVSPSNNLLNLIVSRD